VTVSLQITGIRAAEFSFLVNDEAHDLAIQFRGFYFDKFKSGKGGGWLHEDLWNRLSICLKTGKARSPTSHRRSQGLPDT
jgi:hypothetical protein